MSAGVQCHCPSTTRVPTVRSLYHTCVAVWWWVFLIYFHLLNEPINESAIGDIPDLKTLGRKSRRFAVYSVSVLVVVIRFTDQVVVNNMFIHTMCIYIFSRFKYYRQLKNYDIYLTNNNLLFALMQM